MRVLRYLVKDLTEAQEFVIDVLLTAPHFTHGSELDVIVDHANHYVRVALQQCQNSF